VRRVTPAYAQRTLGTEQSPEGGAVEAGAGGQPFVGDYGQPTRGHGPVTNRFGCAGRGNP